MRCAKYLDPTGFAGRNTPWRGLFALAVCALVTGQSAWASEETAARDERLRQRLSNGVLRWGGDAEGGAPYQLRDPHNPGRVIGFEVELADALADVLAKRLGISLTAEFVQYQWESLELGLLLSKDYDCIISGFEITPTRRENMLFTRPYYAYAEQLVVRVDEQHINGLDDCVDRAVGTLAGSAAERLLTARGVHEIVAFDGQIEPYLDLELGRLDAVLLDSIIALYYASINSKLKYVGGATDPGYYAIALRPEDQDLAEALDEGLIELIRDGRLSAILRRWHLWNEQQAALATGEDRAAQLTGLGFTPAGEPAIGAAELTPADAVDIHIIASSAQLWTFRQYAPLLLRAAGMTLFLTICSMAAAVCLALPICLVRLYGPVPLRWAALIYVEFFRGIPLLLLLFVLYFGLSGFDVQMSAIVTAIVGFGLNYAAYEAEIYRSSILAIPAGQWEAGQALGMTQATTFRRIILPQALQTALGPMTNDFVALFKDTSLVSVIAVRELTKEYLILSRSSLKFLELGLLTAALYLCMSVPLGYLSRYLEQRFKAGR